MRDFSFDSGLVAISKTQENFTYNALFVYQKR